MKGFKPLSFLPFAKELLDHLRAAGEFYSATRDATVDDVASYLEERFKSWDPQYLSKSMLDDPTRAAAARFVAGIACNLMGA
jgi:hypothetical protein